MSKISYANKQTAVNPETPAANEVFTAANANEVKASVNMLYDIVEAFELPDGFVSGPELETINTTTVAIQTNTQGVPLVYNANGTKYTIAAGTPDMSFVATAHSTYDRACIIQGNGVTISLKQGAAGAIVVKPIPDPSYVELYSFTINTSGISGGSSNTAGYAKMNNLNTGDLDITGAYKINGVTVNQDNIPDGTTNKAYTSSEKTKLAGIATNATANDTDANLKNRANHTGTQPASTITNMPFEIGLALSDESNDLTAGTAKATFRVPYAVTITNIYASVNTAPTGSTLVVDINENGSSILSTKLSIDATEKTSTTAATPYVLSDTVLAADSEITIDIDQIGSVTAGKGLKVFIIGTRN